MSQFQKMKEERREERRAKAARKRKIAAGEITLPDINVTTYEVTSRHGTTMQAQRPARMKGQWLNRETRRRLFKKDGSLR